MARMKINKVNMSDLGIISQVAHMYYNLQMQQPEIARRLYFSRPKVSRMLKKARELGVVDIRVNRYQDRLTSIEQKMKDLFHLKEVIVLSGGDDTAGEVDEGLTNFAALYVSQLLKNNINMGITGGGTVYRVIKKMPKVEVKGLNAVQVIGASANQYIAGEARELVNHISTLLSASGHYLNTPLCIDDLYAKNILMQDPNVGKVLAYMKRLDMLVTGIGSFSTREDAPVWFGYMTPEHREELQAQGAVGSICAQYFNIKGELLDCEWNRKCVAIPFEDMHRTPLTIGVAAGPKKVLPILGALHGQHIQVLITDADTAGQIIEHEVPCEVEKAMNQ